MSRRHASEKWVLGFVQGQWHKIFQPLSFTAWSPIPPLAIWRRERILSSTTLAIGGCRELHVKVFGTLPSTAAVVPRAQASVSRQVQVQLKPLWRIDTSRRCSGLCIADTSSCNSGLCVWHVHVQLRSLWCRHLKEQHLPLLSRQVQVQRKPCRHVQVQYRPL